MRNFTRRAWRLFVYLVGICCCSIASAQDYDWKWQAPKPQGNTLTDMQFVDSRHGWSVGESGTIMRTTDEGATWTRVYLALTRNLRGVYFSDALNGWAVGDTGTILHTTNKGLTWTTQYSGVTDQLNKVYFHNAQTGWVVGKKGKILKTTNGGQHWQILNTGAEHHFNSVCFIGLQTGWAVADGGKILKTTDGGQNWQDQSSWWNADINSVHFLTSQIGWLASDNGMILKTTDGGQNWQSANDNSTVNYLYIHFNDLLNGWASGENGTLAKSTDGGLNWTSVWTGFDYAALNAVHISDSQSVVAVGINGLTLYRTNGALTWTATGLGYGGSSVYFINAKKGWAAGGGGTILKTINGGRTWQRISSLTINSFNGVYFADSLHGWVVGQNRIIYGSSDGGYTWEQQSGNTWNEWFSSVSFSDAKKGWAVGSGLTIKGTTNGQNWGTIQETSLGYTLNSVYCLKGTNLAWAVGSDGASCRTNGGPWSCGFGTITTTLKSVFFIDAQTGWVAGYNGLIRKSSDGGSTWQTQSSGTSNDLNGIFFTDTQNGCAIGAKGTILKTTNGGLSWFPQESGTNRDLYSVFFTDNSMGWIVGNGVILTTLANIDPDPDEPASLLTGHLFEKQDLSCSPSLVPVAGRLIKAEPGPYYAISKGDGNFGLMLPVKDSSVEYTLKTVNLSSPTFSITTVCPPTTQIQVVVDTLPDTLSGNDFGFEITPCHHLIIEIATNRRRRCFRNTSTLFYVNQGSLSAPNAYVIVEFPHWVRPVSASIPHIALNDSTWSFNLDTVSAGESGSFTIVDSVICGHPDIRNLTQCTKASIYPAPDCPSPNWNGAEISATGTCLNGIVVFDIRNKTPQAMADTVDYWLYLDSIQVKTGKVKLAAGDSLLLWLETGGLTAHLTVNQVANHPTEVFVSATIEACSDTTFIPRQVANRFPKDQSPNSKTHCLPIRDSYDPNDKQAFPIGFTANHVVKPGTEMEYLVRFQNTGNDTAFTVYVIDSLDNNLNVESLEIGAVSHPYELTLQTTRQGRNFLRFQFNNIMLPDSNTNELKSHGFIQYRIKPKDGIPLGTQARNEAEIYFDFNPPVYTNTTVTTFDNRVFTDTSLNGNVYSQEPVAPTLNTTLLSGVTLTSAVSGGTITHDGGPDVTVRGVVWDTAQNPTIALSTKTEDGSGTGSFTSNLTNLQPSTTYYLRAYATNAVGTAYGEERQFTTLTPATVASVSWLTVTDITTTTASTSSRVITDGGSAVTVRGVVWNTSPDPTIALPTKTVDGADTGTFTSNLSNLQPGTQYYVRAYATNSVGTSYGEERQFTTLSPATIASVITGSVSAITTTSASTSNKITADGGAPVTARGVVWDANPSPTIALPTKTVDGVDTGTFTSNLSNLQPGTQYYVRAYATNAVGTAYGEERQFTTLTPATVASVSWLTVTDLTTTTASTSSRVITDGGSAVTVRGVVWNTSPDPTIALPTKTVDGADTGNFTSELTGLQPATQYYVRAYATNSVGTAYGEERQFTTLLIEVNPMERGREVMVSPNPFGNRLFLKAEVGREISISIQDVLGKEWLSTRFTGSKELELGHLPSGIYLLHFPELNRVLKVVKE